MVFELYGEGKVIGKNVEKGIFGNRYVIAFEANVDGRRLTGTRRVGFDDYSRLNVGSNIPLTLFSGNGVNVTSSKIDASLESLFGAFVHPDFRGGEQ